MAEVVANVNEIMSKAHMTVNVKLVGIRVWKIRILVAKSLFSLGARVLGGRLDFTGCGCTEPYCYDTYGTVVNNYYYNTPKPPAPKPERYV